MPSTDFVVSLWADKPRYKVRSQGGTHLLRRTKSVIGAKAHQRATIESLSLGKIDRHVIISRDDWGRYAKVKHLVTEVAEFNYFIPKGNYVLVETAQQSYLSLGDGGMSDVQLLAHVESGDVSVEADGGEFLQWHSEGPLNSVWWSCDGISVEQMIRLVTDMFGHRGSDDAAAAIRFFDAEEPTELSATDLEKYAKKSVRAVDFFVVDYEGLSLSWMSAESPGRERQDSVYGEVSAVYERDRDEFLVKLLESTATPTIGMHAASIIDRIAQRRFPRLP